MNKDKMNGSFLKKEDNRESNSARSQRYRKMVVLLFRILCFGGLGLVLVGDHIGNQFLIKLGTVAVFLGLFILTPSWNLEELLEIRWNKQTFFPSASLSLDFWAPLDSWNPGKRNWLYLGSSLVLFFFGVLLLFTISGPFLLKLLFVTPLFMFGFLMTYPNLLVRYYRNVKDEKKERERNNF